MRIKDGFAVREIVGEQVIMPTGANIAKFDGAVVLSETAAFAYKLLEEAKEQGQEKSLEELAQAVTEEYDVDFETAKADLEECFKKLEEIKVVEM